MIFLHKQCIIGPLQDPVTWYGINYTGTQITQWDFQNNGTLTSPARLSFVWKVSLRHLRPSVIYSVPSDRILKRTYLHILAMGVHYYSSTARVHVRISLEKQFKYNVLRIKIVVRILLLVYLRKNRYPLFSSNVVIG